MNQKQQNLISPEKATKQPSAKVEYLDKKTKIKQEVIEELKKVAGSEARVKAFAKVMDKYGVDAIIGLFPEVGDAASSAFSGLYLIFEAQRSDLDAAAYIKIIGLQVADFFVGAVPVVGDVMDYFFKANEWSVSMFEEKKKEVIAKARKAGVEESEIAKIEADGKLLPQLLEKITSVAAGAATFAKAA
ncbi:MAG: DUF4112 domain-containing protein [Candidatus Gracilibacteria bacterium]|jgi:hypothetical protein|nr:DUF4112 domain-containing protein [Candidatus Gracilibacteria bacterium]MDD5178968.1 DUF4112 domain-containing protein [Candidatus Gracilibacteria bacterium]